MSGLRTIGRSMLAIGGVVALMAAMPLGGSYFHTELVKSDPAANETLTKSPRVIRLWFSERVDIPVTSVKLESAAGAPIALSPVSRPDTAALAPIQITVVSPLANGSYTLNWSTAGKDGHPAKGSYGFVVQAK